MQQEINKIINEHLPAQVGDVLRSRLEKADKDESIIISLKDRIIELENDNRKLQDEVNKLYVRINQELDLDYQQNDLEKRERNLELEINKIKLIESEKRSDMMLGLVTQVFRSPVYRKSVENMTLGSYDAAGRYNLTNAVPTHITETED